MPKRWYNTSFE